MREQIEAAVKVLKEGGVILYPTDTIWGIGCDATNAEAVEKVFKIKNRADSKSLIVLAEYLDMVARFVKEVPEIAINLVEVNDKPMTIIYPNAEQLAANVVAEDGSVGMRIPDHEFCRNLLRRFRRPIFPESLLRRIFRKSVRKSWMRWIWWSISVSKKVPLKRPLRSSRSEWMARFR